MNPIENLTDALKACIPQLDSAPLLHNPPADGEQKTVLSWMYQHLSQQNLMAYEEWSEYNGAVPPLAPLASISLAEEPADYIFSLIEAIDWSTASLDPSELPYVLPWLEHINFYLKPHGLRLVDILPFENAYILCVRDDDALLQRLDAALAAVAMEINPRHAMDQQQASADIDALIAG